MYKLNIHLLLLIIVFSFISCSQEKELIWEENFEGTSLNEEFWNFELGNGCPQLCGWGNNELQLYTENNHLIKDGYLVITAKKEDSIYTSTRITTKKKVEIQYGKIEIRAKLPLGKGLWPAFWMLGSNIDKAKWPLCGEIDILEYVGKEPGKIFNSLHTKNSHGNTLNTKKTHIERIENGFHIYAIEWTKDYINFFVDNQLHYSFSPENKTEDIWPFDQPFYMLINLAIGGGFGGPEVDDAIFPQEFVIDYIKVYK